MEVYFDLNRINGKAYVGWTKLTAPQRFKQHCADALHGSRLYFHNAIRKYGPDAFDVITVYKGDDAEEMKQVEKNYIAGMRTNDSRFGYNLTTGGDGGKTSGSWIKGHIPAIGSGAQKGNKNQANAPITEARRQASRNNLTEWNVSQRGVKRPDLVGRDFSESTRTRMSLAWTPERRAVQRQRLIDSHKKGVEIFL